jgi:NOL1/NOP2/fmu family ribosome biogenesis protein
MFLAHIVKQITEENTPKVALDLCAAPGGKSTLLADFLPKNSLLVANEVIRSRVNILAENITKWGNPNVAVTNNDAKDFARLPEFFDAIFVDAPCSGEGMFRKDEKARAEWSEANVQLCAERQRRIVADVWRALKSGGYLVYSTCTFNTKENEENVRWIAQELGAESVQLDVPKEWNITLSEELQTESAQGIHGYRFFPHRVKGEGFFVAVLRKVESHAALTPSLRGARNEQRGNLNTGHAIRDTRIASQTCDFSGAKKSQVASRKSDFRQAQNDVQAWLSSPADFTFTQTNSFIKAFSSRFGEHIAQLSQALRLVQSGIILAEVKGKDYIPHHSLALSTALNAEAFPCIDLDLHNALLFLKKEVFTSPSQSKGFELVRYNGFPLGFVKNLGNRCNNLFPQEWRIRMEVK